MSTKIEDNLWDLAVSMREYARAMVTVGTDIDNKITEHLEKEVGVGETELPTPLSILRDTDDRYDTVDKEGVPQT
jgi:hypothetical protein